MHRRVFLALLLLLAPALAAPPHRVAAQSRTPAEAAPGHLPATAHARTPAATAHGHPPAGDHGRTGAPDGGYTDPFAYCAAVGTVDQPDGRWAGPPVPDPVIEGLIRAAELPAGTPREQLARSTFWRCMGGRVYACFVGANLPCQAKADTRRTPSPAMRQFCQQNPDADSIPAVVTGRETVYAWRCRGTRPAVVRQVTRPDARGFLKNIWYQIRPR